MSAVSNISAKLKTNFKRLNLAMDIGSYYTRIRADRQLIFNEPTCFLFDQQRQAVLSVGRAAEQVAGKEPTQTKVVFPIRQGVIYDQQQFHRFLQAVLQEIQSQLGWSWLSRGEVKCALPANATQFDQKVMTDSLSDIFNFLKIDLIPKSRALLNRLGRDSEPNSAGQQIVILDIGHQLTELAIGTKGFVSFSQTLNCGGSHITIAIQQCLKQQHDLLISKQQAAKIKHNLQYNFALNLAGSEISSQKTAEHKINIRGISLADHMVMTQTIQAQDLIAAIETELTKMSHKIKRAFSDLKSEQLISGLNNGIILTGGSSQLFGLDDYLTQELQANVMVSDQVFNDVVLGLVLD